MINALINPTSLDLEDIVGLFYDTDQPLIPHLITANRACAKICEAMTNITVMYPLLHLSNGFSQVRGFFWCVPEYPKSEPKRSLLADPG
jgi:hypothetical protein